MDHLPPEICHHIYSKACTDGGKTGRSLALVSKYIHETSKAYRLQSVSLRGADHARDFALSLDCTPYRERLIVELSVRSDADATRYTSPENWLSPYQRMSRLEKIGWHIGNIDPITKFYREYRGDGLAEDNGVQARNGVLRNALLAKALWKAVSHILMHLRRDALRTLTMSAPPLLYMPHEFSYVSLYCEQLSSLTIDTWMESFTFIGLCRSTQPTLRYLDIKGIHSEWKTQTSLFSLIAALAPSLVYLRLPAKVTLGANTPPLQWFHDYCERDEKVVTALPSTIEMLFVQHVEMTIEPNATDEWHVWFEQHAQNLSQWRSFAEDDFRTEVVECEDYDLRLEQLIERKNERDGT